MHNILERPRCTWPKQDRLYVAYHDEEWGVPEYDPRALWEKLVLDGFQAGLSWITILRKRDAFREAFADFDPEIVARFDSADIARLMANPGIRGAQIWLDLREAGTDFTTFLWAEQDFKPIHNHFQTSKDVPAETPQSIRMAKLLKSKGFNFCGPVITYAFMQAVGMVNDHLCTCYRHSEVMALPHKY